MALIWILTGCTQPVARVVLPKMERIPKANLSWTDVRVDGKQLHALTADEWNHIQVELINRRISGNVCIDMLNNINAENK